MYQYDPGQTSSLMWTSFKSTWLYKRRADAAALACLVLFFVAFFPRAIFGGRFIIAGDSFFYSYPMRTIAWRMIRAGTLPLWTPSILSGYPLLSMAQLGLGYPLTWGYLFLPGHVAEQIYVLAPFLLAPLFTYLYLREIRRTPLAALFGALIFGYGGMSGTVCSRACHRCGSLSDSGVSARCSSQRSQHIEL